MDVNYGPVLYVEDSRSDQKLMEMALSELGLDNKLIIANDGEAALTYLKDTRVQTFIIISDINMPGMNGLELKEIIEANPELKQRSIPFVYMSSSATKPEIEKAYLLGVQGYFSKPDSLDELVEVLRMVTNYWKKCKHPKNM